MLLLAPKCNFNRDLQIRFLGFVNSNYGVSSMNYKELLSSCCLNYNLGVWFFKFFILCLLSEIQVVIFDENLPIVSIFQIRPSNTTSLAAHKFNIWIPSILKIGWDHMFWSTSPWTQEMQHRENLRPHKLIYSEPYRVGQVVYFLSKCERA